MDEKDKRERGREMRGGLMEREVCVEGNSWNSMTATTLPDPDKTHIRAHTQTFSRL